MIRGPSARRRRVERRNRRDRLAGIVRVPDVGPASARADVVHGVRVRQVVGIHAELEPLSIQVEQPADAEVGLEPSRQLHAARGSAFTVSLPCSRHPVVTVAVHARNADGAGDRPARRRPGSSRRTMMRYGSVADPLTLKLWRRPPLMPDALTRPSFGFSRLTIVPSLPASRYSRREPSCRGYSASCRRFRRRCTSCPGGRRWPRGHRRA